MTTARTRIDRARVEQARLAEVAERIRVLDVALPRDVSDATELAATSVLLERAWGITLEDNWPYECWSERKQQQWRATNGVAAPAGRRRKYVTANQRLTARAEQARARRAGRRVM